MNLAHVLEVVGEISRATPEPVRNALAGVEMVVCRKPFGGMPADVRGMYQGDFTNDTDDELVCDPPVGCIFLVADNLVDKDDARAVLLHEIGHALGLDEHEVAGLGL